MIRHINLIVNEAIALEEDTSIDSVFSPFSKIERVQKACRFNSSLPSSHPGSYLIR
jgi:hypothetical protein